MDAKRRLSRRLRDAWTQAPCPPLHRRRETDDPSPRGDHHDVSPPRDMRCGARRSAGARAVRAETRVSGVVSPPPAPPPPWARRRRLAGLTAASGAAPGSRARTSRGRTPPSLTVRALPHPVSTTHASPAPTRSTPSSRAPPRAAALPGRPARRPPRAPAPVTPPTRAPARAGSRHTPPPLASPPALCARLPTRSRSARRAAPPSPPDLCRLSPPPSSLPPIFASRLHFLVSGALAVFPTRAFRRTALAPRAPYLHPCRSSALRPPPDVRAAQARPLLCTGPSFRPPAASRRVALRAHAPPQHTSS